MKQKTLSAVLATLLLTTPLSASASDSSTPTQATESQEQAVIAKVRELLGGLKDLPQAKAIATMQQDARSFWTVLFAKGDPLEAKKNLFNAQVDYVEVFVDAKTMEPFYLYQERADWKEDVGQPNESLAREKADSFLKMALPHLADKMKFHEVFPFGTNSSVVSYLESVNGIPNPSNYVSIHVDGAGHVLTVGTVTGNDSSKLPVPSKLVPLQEAEKLYLQDFTMDFYYRLQNQTLAYKPVELPAIDAQTGAYLSDKPAITSQPLKRTGEGWQTIAYSEQEARNIYARMTGVKSDSLTLGEQMLPNAMGTNWELHWTTPTSQWNDYSAQFYAGTYQLKLVSFQPRTPFDAKPTLTFAEGRDKAMAHLQHVLPEGEHILFPLYENDLSVKRPNPKFEGTFLETYPRMAFTFTASHQGVKVADLTYSVDIDSVTGELLFLGLPDQTDLAKLPDATQAVDADKVRADYLRAHPLELSYDLDGRLVYQPLPSMADHGFYIDALTGKEVNE